MDAKHALGEPRLLVSRSALLHNANYIRSRLAPGVKLCAIVKADAYGLGASLVVDALCNFARTGGSPASVVDELAVATLDEAEAVPPTGLRVQVLRPVENVFLGRQRLRFEHAIRSGWTLTLGSASAADDLARVALAAGRRGNVQVMVDTGMHRGGASPADLAGVVHRVLAHPSLRLTGIMSHLVNGEVASHPRNRTQLAEFLACTAPLWPAMPAGACRHLCNSGGMFFMPDGHLDMVRPGISLYGIDPTGRPSLQRPLKPAMKWLAPLIDVRTVRRGESAGYSQTWVSPRNTRLGLVPCGYADGYPLRLSGRGVTLVGGAAASVVGRVSMDLLTIDLGPDSPAAVGDDVTLIDDDPLSPASVHRLAELAETIPYALISGIGKRVLRVPVDPTDTDPDAQLTDPAEEPTDTAEV